MCLGSSKPRRSLDSKLRSGHITATIDNFPSVLILDVADETHQSVHVNSPWCRLRGFSVVGNAQRGLVSGFSGTDDGEDNLQQVMDGVIPGGKSTTSIFSSCPKYSVPLKTGSLLRICLYMSLSNEYCGAEL